jgi:hypothetical protein
VKRSRLTAALYLGIAFLSGAAVGGFGGWRANTVVAENSGERRASSAEMKKQYMADMTARLKLSEDQVNRLSQILDDTRLRLKRVNDKRRPEYTAIQDDHRRQIRDILDPAQKLGYEELRAEWQARAKEREHAKRQAGSE